MQVSVIVPTCNSAQFLGAALTSIRNQTGIEIELLVVDANSTDGSQELAMRFVATIITQQGRGLSDAWNLGVGAAKSPYIAFLDSDDFWANDSLARRVDALAGTVDAGISLGAVRHFVAEGEAIPAGFRPHLFERDLVSPIPGTMVIARSVFEKVGLFETSIKTAGDVDWVARARNAGIKFIELDELVLMKRVHGTNLTRDAAIVNAELLQVLRKNIARKRTL
jgi:glycosyltransferase involved in cell wall biosynthesis